MRVALSHLPTKLDEVYDEVLRRIYSQESHLARLAEQTLSWISYAFRPLTIRELQSALGVEPGDTTFDIDGIIEESVLISVCEGLITIDEESRIIRLVHHTTQVYLERIRDSQFPSAEVDIARICITYLSFDDFADGCCGPDWHGGGLFYKLQKYPLLRYAATYWGYHTRGKPEAMLEYLILDLLSHQAKVDSFFQAMDLIEGSHYGPYRPTRVPPISAAASFDLRSIVQLLIEQGANLHSADSNKYTALHHAVCNRHDSVALTVLEHGADLGSRAFSEGSNNLNVVPIALIIAIENADRSMAKLLLRYGAPLNTRDVNGFTALHEAVSKLDEEIVQLLLSSGADVDARSIKGSTPLMMAARTGHTRVTDLLIKSQATVNIQDVAGGTALIYAAQRGHVAITRLLLECGADVHLQDGWGQTALFGAARDGQEAVTLLLLAKGAYATMQDHDGCTALMLAADGGQESIVRLLIEKGANPHSRNVDGKTALFIAAEGERNSVVEALHELGADLHVKDSKGRLPHGTSERFAKYLNDLFEWNDIGGAAGSPINRDGIVMIRR